MIGNDVRRRKYPFASSGIMHGKRRLVRKELQVSALRHNRMVLLCLQSSTTCCRRHTARGVYVIASTVESALGVLHMEHSNIILEHSIASAILEMVIGKNTRPMLQYYLENAVLCRI